MLLEIVEQDRQLERERRLSHIDGIKVQLKAECDRTDQLLNFLIKGLINEDDYIRQKNISIQTIADLKETLRYHETAPDRLEPLDLLIKELNEAIDFDSKNSFPLKRDFIRKIGSNLVLRAGTIEVELKPRWRSLMDWKSELPSAWSKMSPDRKRVSLCSLRERVR